MRNFLKSYWVLIIGGLISIIAVASPFFINPSNDVSINWARSQVTLSAIAFPAIFYAFYSTAIQLRKSMAKPRIKVAFNEKGEQQATLIYKDGRLDARLPHPWLINKGNAVARYFQIDFVIPGSVGSPSAYVPMRKDNGDYILTYINEGRYTLFVGRPYFDVNMLFSSAIDINKCRDISGNSFEIEYRVYGDWAETQEGKLKVIINKQQETSDAAG